MLRYVTLPYSLYVSMFAFYLSFISCHLLVWIVLFEIKAEDDDDDERIM